MSNKDKLNSPFVGPYLIVGQPGDVTYTLQESEGSECFTIHVDHLKEYYSDESLVSWLPLPDSQVVDGAPDTNQDQATEVIVRHDVRSSGDAGTGVRRGERVRRNPERYADAEY